MVNKIAVMAVVLVVAIPILMGYGLAFEDVQKTTWSESNTRSITSLLYNDTVYSGIALNSYSLNSNIVYGQYYPEYVKVDSSPITSLPIAQESFDDTDTFIPNNYGTGFVFIDTNWTARATINYTSGGVPTTATHFIRYMEFNGTTVSGKYLPVDTLVDYEYENVTSVTFSEPYTVQYEVSSGSYADITYGWKLSKSLAVTTALEANTVVRLDLIGTFINAVVTMDVGNVLESLSPGNTKNLAVHPHGDESSYPTRFSIYRGTPGESTLTISGRNADGTTYSVTTPLNDTDFSKNVYQLLFSLNGLEVRYIGSWPGSIGAAPSLATWYFDNYYNSTPATYFDSIFIRSQLSYSPIFRIDTAIRQGFPSPAITDVTYDPSGLMPDPSAASYSISLSDIGNAGTSIGWGGETFDIVNGAISVNNKKIALSNLTLESRYLDGVRTNYINGKEISTGSNALQLNGTWTAIISISELTSETSTVSEWQPGQFAWNGVDSSFALMGLLGCIAIFVALGMYGRRSGAKVGTLMLICGGAALIFLALI